MISVIKPKPKDVDLVFYHGRCPDGSCSRWGAERVLRDRAEYVPAYYYVDLPDVSGRNVAFLDFAPKRSVFQQVVEKASSVIVLDHHISSRAEIGDFDCVTIGEHGPNSGASMSWDFFNPDTPRPFIVEHVRMGDTFRWPSDEIREVSNSFMTWFNGQDYSIDLYEEFVSPSPISRFGSLVEVGRALNRHDLLAIERTVANSAEISVQGRSGRIANGSHLRSDVATYMYEKMGAEVGVVYCYDELRDTTVFSLRAAPDSDIDLTRSAKLIPDGGGHATACGFSMPGPYNPKLVRELLAREFND